MGSGGIGGYYGGMLQNGGADVTFIARGAHLKALQENGIALEGEKPLHLPNVKATDDPATIGPVGAPGTRTVLPPASSTLKVISGQTDIRRPVIPSACTKVRLKARKP